MNPATSNLIFFGLIMAIFYFFFIRPQGKKQKAQNAFVDSLQKGDHVVTSSGIVGKISKVDPNIIELQVDQKTFLKVLRSTISKELTDALNNADK